MKQLWFDVISKKSVEKKGIEVNNLYVIGHAGRDVAKTEAHIVELEALGVPRPESIPDIYYCSPETLTQGGEIQVVGKETSGEVEFIFVRRQGIVYVGIGSDHTDRSMEGYSLLRSKQVCAKPLGTQLWLYEDVKDHWDSLEMISWQVIDGKETLYQKGSAADLLHLDVLLAAAEKVNPDLGDSLCYSGTVTLVDGFKYGTHFKGVIKDNKLGRSLELNYDIKALKGNG